MEVMNFPQFLENVRTLKNICSLRDLYDFYGGENRLAMSLRHFQLICSGKSPPNERLLTTVFEKSPACDRSSLVLAYLKSTVGAKEGNEANLLLSFVEQNLLSGEEFEAKSLWETVPQHQTYTESQLDCLISDPVIFRFYMRLLLLNDCPIKECRLPDATIRKLQKLDLVQVTKNYIQPAMQFMKLPRYEDSSPF
jgi:hypothetical protein